MADRQNHGATAVEAIAYNIAAVAVVDGLVSVLNRHIFHWASQMRLQPENLDALTSGLGGVSGRGGVLFSEEAIKPAAHPAARAVTRSVAACRQLSVLAFFKNNRY